MAVTAAGTPYVESSDNVADYPGVSLALANHIDTIGKVLQVVSVTKTDTFSTSSTSYTDVTGLAATITPRATTSKILIYVDSNYSNLADRNGIFRLVRDSTPIALGDTAGSRSRGFAQGRPQDTSASASITTNFLDSPSTTSATTYKVQMLVQSGTGEVNQLSDSTDSSQRGRTISSITLTEVSS